MDGEEWRWELAAQAVDAGLRCLDKLRLASRYNLRPASWGYVNAKSAWMVSSSAPHKQGLVWDPPHHCCLLIVLRCFSRLLYGADARDVVRSPPHGGDR